MDSGDSDQMGCSGQVGEAQRARGRRDREQTAMSEVGPDLRRGRLGAQRAGICKFMRVACSVPGAACRILRLKRRAKESGPRIIDGKKGQAFRGPLASWHNLSACRRGVLVQSHDRQRMTLDCNVRLLQDYTEKCVRSKLGCCIVAKYVADRVELH